MSYVYVIYYFVRLVVAVIICVMAVEAVIIRT